MQLCIANSFDIFASACSFSSPLSIKQIIPSYFRLGYFKKRTDKKTSYFSRSTVVSQNLYLFFLSNSSITIMRHTLCIACTRAIYLYAYLYVIIYTHILILTRSLLRYPNYANCQKRNHKALCHIVNAQSQQTNAHTIWSFGILFTV